MKTVSELIFSGGEGKLHQVAFSQIKRGVLVSITYGQYFKAAEQCAVYLCKLGVRPGDKVVTIMTNGFDWNILDLAIQQLGAVQVSIFPNYSRNDFDAILTDVAPSFIFTNTPVIAKILTAIVDERAIRGAVFKAEEFIAQAQADCSSDDEAYELQRASMVAAGQKVGGESLSTIYYTSGTFDKPNGVMITHQAIVNAVLYLTEVYAFESSDVVLSYLPISHALERTHSYTYQQNRLMVYYADSMRSIPENLVSYRPTFFVTTPMIIENIYATMLSMVSAGAEQSELKVALAQLTGGGLRTVGVAGAALAPEVSKRLLALELKVWEHYGMTECCPICMSSDKYGVLPGTVGVAVTGVEIRIEAEGEVWVRSPNNMKGYFKNEALTELVLDKDGWIHTGDTGEWVEGKFLRLTGRVNDRIKLSNGLFISPVDIEKKLVKSGLFLQVFVFNRAGLKALLVPHPSVKDAPDLNEKVAVAIRKFYNDNETASRQIIEYKLQAQPFAIETGELTPNMKIKRRVVFDKFAF